MVALTIITLLHVPRGHTCIRLRHFLLSLVSCLICKERNKANYKDGSSIYQSVWVTENILSLNELRWDDTGCHLIHRTPFKLRILQGCRPRAQVASSAKAEVHRWRVKKRDTVEVLINFQHSVSLSTQRRNTVLIMTTLISTTYLNTTVNLERNAHNYKSWGVRPQVMAVAFACYN